MNREVLIINYLQAKLSEEERKEFDSLLRTDKAFAEEVKFHRNLKRVAEEEDDKKFRGLLHEFENEINQANSNTSRIDIKWLIAASIILLLGIGVFFNLNRPISGDELFLDNFEPYPNVIHPIERGTQELDLKTRAFSAYEEENYKEALAGFDSLYLESKETYYLFYMANAKLALDQPSEAIPLLLEFSETDDTLADKTGWYLAMAYLKIGDKEGAKKVLDSIITNNMYLADDPDNLMRSLD